MHKWKQIRSAGSVTRVPVVCQYILQVHKQAAIKGPDQAAQHGVNIALVRGVYCIFFLFLIGNMFLKLRGML